LRESVSDALLSPPEQAGPWVGITERAELAAAACVVRGKSRGRADVAITI
jgi:hypothetical protein